MSKKEQNIAFLLIHGFTGTHFEMVPLEEFLTKKGYTVKNIILPGHETNLQDLARTKWTEWVDYAQKQLNILLRENFRVYICGLSMGAAITLFLAAKNPKIAGAIPLAAPYKPPDWRMFLLRILPLHLLIKSISNEERGWEDMEALKTHKAYGAYPLKSVRELYKFLFKLKKIIPEITVPTIIFQAKKDPSIPPKFPLKILEKISSDDKELVWIEKGGHVIPKDAGREQLFSELEKWLEKRI